MPNNKLEAALQYAARGWCVFPLHSVEDGHCSCGKPSCERGNWGKHPRVANGLLAGTTDEEQIRRWWSQSPNANIGIRTGAESGLVVLDVDPPKGGDDSLERLQRDHGDLPETVETQTGTGGRHLLFQHPGRELRNSAGKLGAGLDVRGDGGYIVAPPGSNGVGPYGWSYGPDAPLAELPTWFLSLLGDSGPRQTNSATPEDDGLIEAGQRNDKLASLAGKMRRDGFGQEAIEAALLAENLTKCSPPLREDEVRRVAKSIGRYSPKKAPTDLDNARKFVGAYCDRFRYVYEREWWYVWDGSRWASDVRGAVPEAGKALAGKLGNPVQSRGKIAAMIGVAATDPAFSVRPEDFDTDPWLFNVDGGVIDLRTGTKRLPTAEDMLSKIAAVEFNPNGQADRFKRFLEEILPDAEVRAYVQRLFGYCLTGVVRDHVLALFHGDGGNGKGVLTGAIKALMGDYAWALPPGTLIQQKFQQHTTDITDLEGRRLALASETGQSVLLNEELVKRLTGGDPLTARRMRQDNVSFQPSHKLVLMTNNLPRIRGADAGIWRRMQKVPFEVAIQKPDTELPEKMKAEYPGIFNWMLEGCLEWQEKGLAPPRAVLEATDTYREEQDAVLRFLQEVAEEGPEHTVGATELYAAYKRWCAVNGVARKNQMNFGIDVGRHCAKRKTGGRMVYEGIRLAAPEQRAA